MIEWTQQERQFAKDNGDEDITEVIDGFNHCANSEQMLRYLLEAPRRWSCKRWELIPISKFGDVLRTLLSAENKEVGKWCEKKYEYSYRFLDGDVAADHRENPRMVFGDPVHGRVLVRREVGAWEEVKDA